MKEGKEREGEKEPRKGENWGSIPVQKKISFARIGKFHVVEIAMKRNWVGVDLQ